MNYEEILKEAAEIQSVSIVPADVESNEEKDEEVEEVVHNPLDDLSDDDLIKNVDELKERSRFLKQENAVILHFLQVYDPFALQAMEDTLNNAKALHDRSVINMRRSTYRSSRIEHSFVFSRSNSVATPAAAALATATTAAAPEKEGPKVNISHKSDLVLREMEELQSIMKTFSDKNYKNKCNLVANIEEMDIRATEIQDSMNYFDKIKVNFLEFERVPRYMDEWHKKSRLLVDKIRLRTSSLKVQYQLISNTYAQKLLIGENLQEVDFEQLRIENVHLNKKIEQKNLLLLELKRTNGKSNLMQSQHRNALEKKIEDVNKLKNAIEIKKQETVKLAADITRAENELENAKTDHDKLQTIISTYKAPELIDYIRKKVEVDNLKKELKAWSRRKQMKVMTLNTCLNTMKRLTGCKKTQPSWFLDPAPSRSKMVDPV